MQSSCVGLCLQGFAFCVGMFPVILSMNVCQVYLIACERCFLEDEDNFHFRVGKDYNSGGTGGQHERDGSQQQQS